jgi:hypothetical protein
VPPLGLSVSSPFLVLYVAADDLADIGVLALLDEGGVAETLVVGFDIVLPFNCLAGLFLALRCRAGALPGDGSDLRGSLSVPGGLRSGIEPWLIRWALVMMRLWAACRNTSVRRTTGTAPDEMMSASTCLLVISPQSIRPQQPLGSRFPKVKALRSSFGDEGGRRASGQDFDGLPRKLRSVRPQFRPPAVGRDFR